MAAVEAEGLVKTYRSRSGTVEAVRGVDLRVEAGEVFGFLGPNGAGKSTTVKMLTTLLSITGGHGARRRHRRRASTRRRRGAIGVALQEAGLDPRQTGRELLVLQGRLFDLTARGGEGAGRGAARARRARPTRPTVAIKGYSGGMKRRLDLASALVHEPEVLFLDEPTTGLDPASRLTVWDEVRRINERGTTRLPHDAVPRGGRPALRPPRDHRRRPDRARGHAAAAEGRAARAPRARRRRRRSTTSSSTRPAARARASRRGAGGVGMTHALVLGQRALREGIRTPEAIVPTLFIPLFFLVVNVGQVGEDLPRLDDGVPARPGLRRVPAAELDAARRVVRHRGAVPRRGDRGRLLRQAARDAGPAHVRSCSAA